MRKAANIWRRQGASAAHLFAKQDLYEKAQKRKPISAKRRNKDKEQKIMKKSLVISTIATVLVVVVALTTATFAWFSTSQAAVLTNSFAVATSGSGADIFRWNTEQNNYEATAASEWEMGQYSNPYEWTTPGKAATGTSGAITGYNPIMPVDLIEGTEYDGSNGRKCQIL